MSGPIHTNPVGKFEWEKGIRDHSNLPAGARHIALTLATWMNAKTGEAYPSLMELARASGRAKSTVIRNLSILGDEGFLDWRKGGGRRPDGHGIPNYYKATLPADIEANINNGRTMKPYGAGTVASRTENGSTVIEKGRATDTQTINNNQEQSAGLKPLEIANLHPRIWADALDTAKNREGVRNIEAYATKIANDRVAAQALDEERRTKSQLYDDVISDCDECSSNGWITGDDGMVRHHQDSLDMTQG